MSPHPYERKQVQEQLNKELAHLQFTSQQQVLERTHPVTLKQKLVFLWNKELEIPLVPVATVLVLLIGISLASPIFSGMIVSEQQSPHTQTRELIDTGAGIYWSDTLEKAVSKR